MTENSQTPEEELARAEIDRDSAVGRYLKVDPRTNLIEAEVRLRIVRRKTETMNAAARRMQPPLRGR